MSILIDTEDVPKLGYTEGWYDFGYVCAAYYKRIHFLAYDDGKQARKKIEKGFGVWWDDAKVGEDFVAGWTAYMREHGHIRERR